MIEFIVKNFIPVIIIVIINYCYLLCHSKNFSDSLKYTIPLFLFILYIIFIFIFFNAAGDQAGDYARGYAPVASVMLILPVFMILILVLEFAVIRNLIRDIGQFFSAGRKWNLISILAFLSILAHAAGIFAIAEMKSNPDRTSTFSISGRKVSFNGRYGIEYQGNFWNSSIKEGVLLNDAILPVGNKTLLFSAGDPVRFFGNGSVKSGCLAENTDITAGSKTLKFRRYEKMDFYQNGNVRKGLIAQNAGFELKSLNKNIRLYKDTFVSLYEDGALKEFEIMEPMTLNAGNKKIHLKGSEFGGKKYGGDTSLYHNGSLKSGILAGDISMEIGNQTITFKKDSRIDFYPDGSVKRGVIKNEVTFIVNGTDYYTAEKNTGVLFSEDGLSICLRNLYSVFYLRPDEHLNVICQKGGGSYIYKNKTIYIGNDETVFVHQSDPTSAKYIDENIKIDSIGYLYQDCAERLENNGIEVLPEFEDPEMVIMFRYSDVGSEQIEEILFLERTVISFRDKIIECKPFQWVHL